MLKPELNVHDYLRIIQKRKYIILITVITVTVFTYIFSLSKPVRYRAKVDITFSSNKAISTIVNDVAFNLPNNLNTMARIIKRTSVLEKAAEKLGWIKKDDNVRKKDRVIKYISSKISTSINSQSEIITIHVTSKKAEDCADIANSVAEEFRKDAIYRSSEEIRNARLFVDIELKKSKEKLELIEKKIEKYSKEYGIVDINTELGSLLNLQSTLKNKLTELMASRKTLERKLNTYVNSKGIKRKTFRRILESDTVSSLKNRILEEEINSIDIDRKYKSSHPKFISHLEKINELKRRLKTYLKESFDTILVKYGVEIESIKSKEIAYKTMLSDIKKKLSILPQVKTRLKKYNEDAELYRNIISSYNKKLEELGVLEAEKTRQAPDIINRASIPDKPISSNKITLIGVGSVSGLIIGMFLAFFIETVDSSISTVEEVEEFLKVPVLGILPFMSVDKVVFPNFGEQPDDTKISKMCYTHHAPHSTISEAFKIVRTNLKYKHLGKGKGNSILLTSSLPGEGKTFVAANLSVVYAQLGAKVLLVDLNLRDPEIHDFFGVTKNPGVTDILIGDLDIDEAIKKTELGNLDLLLSGPIPPNPSELLETEKFKELIREIESKYDLIIADSAPFLPVADSSIITSVMSKTIFIHNSLKTGVNTLHRSKLTVENAGSKIDGIILNQLKSTLLMNTEMQLNYYYSKKKSKE